MLRLLSILAFSISIAAGTYCQSFSENDFIRFTNKEGLSDNYVTAIQQDDHGYLWIATDVGLNRYDGHSFKTFYQASGNLPLLSSKIRRLKKFSENQLGIITRSGFQLLNTNVFSIQNFIIEDSTAFTTYRNFVWDALPLSGNTIALTTASGFYVFDNEKKMVFRHDEYSAEDINKKTIRFGRDIINTGKNNYLVYADSKGLRRYNSQTRNFETVNQNDMDWSFFLSPQEKNENWITRYQLNGDQYLFIHYEKDSIVWYDHSTKKKVISRLPFDCKTELNFESKITALNDSAFVLNAGYSGFYYLFLDRSNGKIFCNGKKYLSGHKINTLFTDKDGRLWAGTPEGLLQQKMKSRFLITHSFEASVFNDKLVGYFTDAFRHKNKLYVTRYSNRNGLVIMDTSTMRIEATFSFFGGYHKWNEIFSVQMYHPDTLWLGTNNGIIWFDTKSYRYGEIPLAIRLSSELAFQVMLHPADKNGKAWFTYTQNGIAGYYDTSNRHFTFFTSKTKPAIPFHRIKQVAYDIFGDVWIGGHALSRWARQKEIFDTLITVYAGAKKFNDDILTFIADRRGSLWLHNEENGLLEYRIKEKKFYTYTGELPFYEFDSFSPVINDILWIAGRAALIRFDIKTKQIILFDRNDGLPLHKPTSRYIYYDDHAGFFYLFCKNEIVRFPLRNNPVTKPVSELLIEELKINNGKTFFHPNKTLGLKTKENNIDIHFSVIDFESGQDYLFAYKLNNDEAWINLGQQRNITLTGLPSGSYSIQLKATTKAGIEKTGEILFSIAPPFWKSGWFLLLAFVIFSGGLYFLYRFRINRVKQKANIDKQLAQAEMKALHAQMNPHFIFNCLNSIREMILNNENEQASVYLSKFARLIRITLNHSSKSFVNLTDTIDYLNRYIELEKIRSEHFTCTISVAEDVNTDDMMVPPMLIQPFIENAIWHGTLSKQDLDVQVRFSKKENDMVCVVEDNGIGIEESLSRKENMANEPSVGIANIKHRIELLNEKYNLQSSIKIEDKSTLFPGNRTGTIVTLHLPLKTNENVWTS